MSSKREFQIHLPGLLKVLAENLYSTKKVALRELLQNAHDSCVRRSAEGTDRRYRPRIDVSIDRQRRVLAISDNGSGLTEEEVIKYLSTIGRSYTRELGEKLYLMSPDEAAALIGQFGLGFLSAFLVASEVTLITKSMQPDSEAVYWHSTGDVHYELKPGERQNTGTTVELTVKPAASFLLDEDTVIATIQQYANFLPIPIHVSGSHASVNMQRPPWEAVNREEATIDYIQNMFKTPEPLAVIPLEDQIIDLGHDQISIPLQGFLFIPSHSVASLREYGDMVVFIRHMFICDQQRDLLPPWARFVRGVVDCPYLQPTASREEIHQDDTFATVQRALEQQLLKGLRQIAETSPVTWKRIVRGHSDVIMGWAVLDNQFFNEVSDLITFKTTRGLQTLPDYLALTDQNIYYVTRELGSLQEQLLGESRGVPVIDASWFSVTPFLEKYAAFHPGITLVQLEGDSDQLLRPTAEEPFDALLAFYRSQKIRARVVLFKPEEVPALIIYPKDAEFIIETRNALDSDSFPDPVAGLIGDYLNKMNVKSDDLCGTLYLNASCPFIHELLEVPESPRNAVLLMIYQIARLFAGRTMTPSDIISAFDGTVQSLKMLVKSSDKPS